MLGAMIGDMVGSIYEFNPIKTIEFPLWGKGCRFTDDTVMTAAVAKALMETKGASESVIKLSLIERMQEFGALYPEVGYGPRFREWLCAKTPQPYHSWGNGSAMRVSSVGWLYSSLEETLSMAKLTAEITHNHPEGLKGAMSVAAAIYLLRTGKNKDEVRSYIEDFFQYDFRKSLDVIRPDYIFQESCQGTVPPAMTAFWESCGFEDCIRKAVSLGGDCDTLTAISGSIAEAYYDIPAAIREEALCRLDTRLREIYQEFLIRRYTNEQNRRSTKGNDRSDEK